MDRPLRAPLLRAGLLALATAAAAFLTVGCGGEDVREGARPPVDDDGRGRGAPAERSGGGAGGADLGRSVFLSQCQGCHALGTLGAPKPVGGDLRNYSMSPAEVLSFARIMPTPRRLSERELRAVSEFVSRSQPPRPRSGGRGARGGRLSD